MLDYGTMTGGDEQKLQKYVLLEDVKHKDRN